MNSTYKSDFGKGVLIISIVMLGGLTLLFAFIGMEAPQWIWFMMFLIIGLIYAYLYFLYRNTKYSFEEENLLKITAGFANKTIEISGITSIARHTCYSNYPDVYALSEKRLKITYGNGKYMEISPKGQEGFIKELISLNPRIKVKGTAQ